MHDWQMHSGPTWLVVFANLMNGQMVHAIESSDSANS